MSGVKSKVKMGLRNRVGLEERKSKNALQERVELEGEGDGGQEKNSNVGNTYSGRGETTTKVAQPSADADA